MRSDRVNLDAAHREMLVSLFQPLDALSPGLGRRVLHYLLASVEEAVLEELASLATAGEALGLACAGEPQPFRAARGRLVGFLSASPPQSAPFYLRLARTLHAACAGGPRNLVHPSLPDWVEILLREACHETLPDGTVPPSLSASRMEEVLELAGEPSDLLVRAAFLVNSPATRRARTADLCALLEGFAACDARHGHVIREALVAPGGLNRAYALDLMAWLEIPVAPFLEEVVACATGDSSMAREAAEPLLTADPATLAAVERAAAGTAWFHRRQAALLLCRLDPARAVAFLRDRLQQEEHEYVRDVLEARLAEARAEAPSSTPAAPRSTPSHQGVPEGPQLPGDALARLGELLRVLRASAASYGFPGLPGPPVIDASTQQRVLSAMLDPRACHGEHPTFAGGVHTGDAIRATAGFLERAEVAVPQGVRLLVALGYLPRRLSSWYPFESAARLLTHLTGAGRHCGLREVAAALEEVGYAPDYLARAMFEHPAGPLFSWENGTLEPYFLEHLAVLRAALQPSPGELGPAEAGRRRVAALRLLRGFPRPPEDLRPRLWELGLGGTASERPLARAALGRLPGLDEQLLGLLQAGPRGQRVAAAEWLAELGDPALAPFLRSALGLEKSQPARRAIMDALQRCQGDVSAVLTRDRLAEEARQGLRGGCPSALSWLRPEDLPTVHWASDGTATTREVVTWLIVRAHRAATQEPDVALRHHAGQWHMADRAALGRAVLEAWIERDTKPRYSSDEVERMLQAQATREPRWSAWAARQLRKRLLATSAVDSLGVLALPAACGGAETVAVAAAYLARWRGRRAEQFKALVRMLSWIEHPSAAALLVGIAERATGATLREQARESLSAVARRRGVTVKDLLESEMLYPARSPDPPPDSL